MMLGANPNAKAIPFEADPGLPLPPAIPRGRTNCGDIDIRIAGDGTWFHEGCPFGWIELVKLFASVLTRDRVGAYWLVTPAEMARIRVDDAPFVAVEMTVGGRGRDQLLTFRTNIDETIVCDDRHPIRVETNPKTGEPAGKPKRLLHAMRRTGIRNQVRGGTSEAVAMKISGTKPAASSTDTTLFPRKI